MICCFRITKLICTCVNTMPRSKQTDNTPSMLEQTYVALCVGQDHKQRWYCLSDTAWYVRARSSEAALYDS